MVQSDTLSQQLDFILEKNTDNENMMLILDNLFLNLLDTAPQDRVLDLGEIVFWGILLSLILLLGMLMIGH